MPMAVQRARPTEPLAETKAAWGVTIHLEATLRNLEALEEPARRPEGVEANGLYTEVHQMTCSLLPAAAVINSSVSGSDRAENPSGRTLD